MPSGRYLIPGAAALTALFARLRRRAEPEPTPAPEPEPDVPDEIPAEEVHELREELRRELERLATADVKASRTRRERASPPG